MSSGFQNPKKPRGKPVAKKIKSKEIVDDNLGSDEDSSNEKKDHGGSKDVENQEKDGKKKKREKSSKDAKSKKEKVEKETKKSTKKQPAKKTVSWQISFQLY